VVEPSGSVAEEELPEQEVSLNCGTCMVDTPEPPCDTRVFRKNTLMYIFSSSCNLFQEAGSRWLGVTDVKY
jgi:hypothetical protein